MNFSNSRVEVNGCKVTLRRGGAGRPLLYLHGASGAATVRPFLQELAREYDVFVPEHPGFGGSDEPEWLDNIHDLAYFYLDFMEQFEMKDAIVLGSSIGGWLALEIAVRDTSRIRALSVIGPGGIYAPGLKRGDMFLWSPEEKVRNLFFDTAIADRMLAQKPTPEQIEAEVKNQYTVAKLAWEPRMYDPHLHKWLHRIRMPAQIVWGDSDKVLPAGYAAEFGRLIPQARIDIISACGHLPQVEKPEEFLRVFRDFAARV